MNISRIQKIVALVAGILALLVAGGKGLAWYVDSRAYAADEPTAAALKAHEALPGHPGDHADMQQMQRDNAHAHEDLEYIRGRIDERWGPAPKSP